MKNLNPLISIITVVYNGEKYIEQTINSVFIQSYKNIEYIIIDGNSTDSTIKIIEKYESKISSWISEPDNGLSDAMNKGVALATGDYIIHLHSDDYFISSNSLQLLVSNLLDSDKKWICGFYKYVNSNNEIIKEDEFDTFNRRGMLVRNIIRHQSTMVPSDIFNEIKFDNKYFYAMDYDFFLRVWDKLGAPLFIHEYISYFRLDGTNLSSNFINSIKSEFHARFDYRIRNKEYLFIVYDLVIFILRFLKIIFYHKIRNKKNVK